MHFRLLVLLFLLSISTVLSHPASAWDGEKLTTMGGLLHIDEVDHADEMRLGDVVIPLDGVRAHIRSQLPKTGKAEFVLYSVWGGCGNCGEDFYLLDASTKSPRRLQITTDSNEEPELVSYKSGIVSFRRFNGEQTMLGDSILELVEYRRGDRDFRILRHSAVSNYKDFVGTEITHLLGDFEARYTLVELMGMKAFGEFRDCLLGYDNVMKLVDDRYLVGVGRGHYCANDHDAMIVIDTYFDRAWALRLDDTVYRSKPTTVKAWGTLGKNDGTVRDLLNSWLGGLGKELALQEGPIKIVDAPSPSTDPSSPPTKN